MAFVAGIDSSDDTTPSVASDGQMGGGSTARLAGDLRDV